MCSERLFNVSQKYSSSCLQLSPSLQLKISANAQPFKHYEIIISIYTFILIRTKLWRHTHKATSIFLFMCSGTAMESTKWNVNCGKCKLLL